MSNRIDEYLAALRRELRVSPCFVERILSEIEDHLLEAAEREERHGATAAEAQSIVIARFGSPEVVARWWSEVYAMENGASNMWKRFTERARRVVFFAQEEAARMDGNQVGTEHLLLGLVRESDSVAGQLLWSLGIPAGAIRMEIERLAPRGQGTLGEAIELTPRAKQMIDLAYEEARSLQNNYIGTEHLLLGLIREEEGLGGRVLRHLGADLERTRAAVRAQQEAEKGKRAASPPVPAPPPAGSDPLPTGSVIPPFLRHPGTAPSTPTPAQPAPPQTLWSRFDEPARRAVFFAHEEAAGFEESFIGTEHLLLGIMREPVAAQLLERLGISPERIRERIQEQTTHGQRDPDQPLAWTPRAGRSIGLAHEEARSLGKDSLGLEHLLLGLIREGHGLAARVLTELGGNLERTREMVRSLPEVGPPSPAQTPAPPSAAAEPPAVPSPAPAAVPSIPTWLRPAAAPSPPQTPWAKFNERARRVLLFAQKEAARFGESHFGTEHLLLGILREPVHVAGRILERLGIPPEQIRERIEQQATRGWRNPEQPLEPTPSAVKAIEFAYAEAQTLGHNYIGTEHLLLGLLREGDGLAARVLTELGADLERVRGIVREGGFATPPPTGEHFPGEVPFWLPPRPAPAAGIPWAKLTERARHVVFAAREEAMRRGYRYVFSDVLLLALAGEDSLATRILERLGVSLARLRGEVEHGLPPGPGWSEECDLPPDVETILTLAWEEAQALSHNYLGAEHLLLGFLRQEGRPWAATLGRLGVSLERVREEIPIVGARWAAILEARRRLEEAEAAYRALFVRS